MVLFNVQMHIQEPLICFESVRIQGYVHVQHTKLSQLLPIFMRMNDTPELSPLTMHGRPTVK